MNDMRGPQDVVQETNTSSYREHLPTAGMVGNHILRNSVDDDPGAEMDIPYMNSSMESMDCDVEEILLDKRLVEVPSDLYENEDLYNSFFSIDTWNDLLTEEVKIKLLDLLPSFPNHDIDEKAKTIEMLFGKENLHFGNPLQKFRQDLVAGDYFPDNVAMKEMVRSAQKRNYEEWMEKYNYTLVQEILDSRKSLLEAATGNVVTTPKIDRKRVGKGGNMRKKIRKRYLDEIVRIKKEMGEEGLSSDDEADRQAEEVLKRDLTTKANILLDDQLNPQHMKENIPIEQDDQGEEASSTSTEVSELHSNRRDSLSNFQTSEVLDQGLPAPQTSLIQDMQSCFLSLLRDLFLSGPDCSLTMPQLDQALTQWQESPIAALNPWYQECTDPNGWRSNIPSAIAFMCGSFPEQQPQDFVPFIQVDSVRGTYQWIGAGRDSDSNLSGLNCWWLERLESCRAGFVSQAGGGREAVPPGNTTDWEVKPATLQERAHFQEEERTRYANPGEPFCWTCHDYTAVVGPVKGSSSAPSSSQLKPKNHVMLVLDRPPAVTMLTLVRDAVSRLPNGEGTRTDIVELLKDSQYLVPGFDTTGLTTTVSGALDRLQNEPDAPVKYDSNRKIWIYLHRARSVSDFLRATQDLSTKQPRQRQKRKFKLDSSNSEGYSELSGRGGPSILETALAGVGLSSPERLPSSPPMTGIKQATPPPISEMLNSSQSSTTKGSPVKNVQKIIVKGTDGKVIPLSAATLQKLIEAGAIKPGTQIATPDFLPEVTSGVSSSIRIIQQPASRRNPAPSSPQSAGDQELSKAHLGEQGQNIAHQGDQGFSRAHQGDQGLSRTHQGEQIPGGGQVQDGHWKEEHL